jgi:DNA-directed RNA polymerase subunit M/transcription elongation factor TFIIS
MTEIKLAGNEEKVLEFWYRYMLESSVPPSYEEIRRHLKHSNRSTVTRYMRALCRHDLMSMVPGHARSTRITPAGNAYVMRMLALRLEKLWTQAVILRDKYTCQRCNSRKVSDLMARRLIEADVPWTRFRTVNGFCVCKNCDHWFTNRSNLFNFIFEKLSGREEALKQMIPTGKTDDPGYWTIQRIDTTAHSLRDYIGGISSRKQKRGEVVL